MTIEEVPEADRVQGAPHPRHTAQLFGQAAAEATFLQAFNGGRLHHGWLLTGPRGVGKATLAWRIARFLLSRPPEGASDISLFDEPATEGDHAPQIETLDVSPDHPVARRMAALAEPGLLLCRRPWDEKKERLKKDITVEEVRRLKGFFNLSSAEGGRRVVIVDAADELNPSAANALLKVLEEPPKGATLLLISHRPMRLLPTIRSRCRVLGCAPLDDTDMARALAGAGFEAGDRPEALAALSAGSVGEAIRLLSEDGLDLYAALLAGFSHPTGLDRTAAIRLAQSCGGKGAEARYDLVLRLVPVFLYRLANTGIKGPPDPDIAPQEAALLSRLSPSTQAARLWAELAQELLDRSGHARAVNLDPASVILDMLLKIEDTAGRTRASPERIS